MFGVLLETRARRQRRTGGAALSIAAHVALIGAVTAMTAHGKSAPKEPERVRVIHFRPPPTPIVHPVEHRVTDGGSRAASPISPVIPVLHIDVPASIPNTLPAFDLSHSVSADSIVIGSPRGAGSGGAGHPSLTDGDDGPGNGEWRGTELMMRIVTSAKPRYPEMLRQSGIDGRVLVRFTVDTLGRVDMRSVQIVSSTHDLFTRAVRDALPGFRFKPSEAHGRRVVALAEMPFEFAIK